MDDVASDEAGGGSGGGDLPAARSEDGGLNDDGSGAESGEWIISGAFRSCGWRRRPGFVVGLPTTTF